MLGIKKELIVMHVIKSIRKEGLYLELQKCNEGKSIFCRIVKVSGEWREHIDELGRYERLKIAQDKWLSLVNEPKKGQSLLFL